MNLTRAELIKLRKSALPWVVGGLCLLVNFFLFALYAVNGSSVFEPALLMSGRVASLLLAVFIAIVGVVPAVLIGCYIGAADYGNRTAGNAVQWGGRCWPLAGKVMATTCALCLLVVATGLLGLLLGLGYDANLMHVELELLLRQLVVGMAAAALLGLLALTIGTLARSFAVGSLICLVALFGQMFVPPEVFQMVRFVNPLTFLAGFADPAFSNLTGLTNIAVSFGSDLNTVQSVAGLAAYVCVCLGVLILVARHREYR